MAREVKVTLTANVNSYVAGMRMAAARTSPLIRQVQRFFPVPVWFIGWTRVNDGPRKRVFRLGWIFRGRRIA